MLQQLRLLALCLLTAFSATAQRGVTQPQRDSLPYQKYPSLPAFNLLLQDSATVFNTYNIPQGRPVVLIFFSPDCDHCQQTAKAIMERMDDLKEAQFFFFTPMSLTMLRQFAATYRLNGHKNITVGQDYEYFFPRFYGASYVPYVAVYDRKKKFVKMWEGKVKVEDLSAMIQLL